MSRKYTLDTKIDALNQIDDNDGDLGKVSDLLGIPQRTLRGWRQVEDDLRGKQRKRLRRQRERLAAELYWGMLERGQAILERITDDALDKAPLNQLASALGALVSHALKIKQEIDETDEQGKQIIRFEHYYDGAAQEVPPWAGASEGFDRTLQNSSLWQALGQDRAGQDDPAAGGA
ncbi:MAG: hypothetical protein OXG60_19830 [Chloroflexi bacterium]|nr:hypothetical protein [Chloroflexota bacterium]